jgi:hypothetical protein
LAGRLRQKWTQKKAESQRLGLDVGQFSAGYGPALDELEAAITAVNASRIADSRQRVRIMKAVEKVTIIAREYAKIIEAGVRASRTTPSSRWIPVAMGLNEIGAQAAASLKVRGVIVSFPDTDIT